MRRSLAIALLLATSLARADWQQEHWVVDGFTWALGGGPTSGPAAGVGETAQSLCGDARGNLYMLAGQTVDIVTAAGYRVRLAGTGELGYRDGPAYRAEFRLGEGAYYWTRNIACTPSGTLLVADSGNNAVRRISKENGEWKVTTLRGGRSPPGDEKGGRATTGRGQLKGTLAVAVNSKGDVIVADSYGVSRMSADGGEATYLGPWPESTAMVPGKPARLNPMMGDADQRGNVYFVSRSPDVVIKIDASGGIQHLAGLVLRHPPKPHNIGDVAPLDAFFDTPTSIVAAPDGSAVYVCGGDEYTVRRVPSDGKGTTATLLQNGRWARLSVHPNKVRGKAIVRPRALGKARPEGELSPMVMNHIVGRDAQGNMYALLRRWEGLAPEIEGAGPLPTRIFRLHRTGGD